MVNIVPTLDVSLDEIANFCRTCKVKEFALFGSALREDFRPDSDVDVMVTLEAEARHTLFDLGGCRKNWKVSLAVRWT
jgi:predicted nucleotidyltransferase